MSNIDIRGVKRGACKNCDCEEYMFMHSVGPLCYYCTCPPTKHSKLEDHSTLIQTTEHDSSATSHLNQHIDSVPVDAANVSEDVLSEIRTDVPQISDKLQDLESLLPGKFPEFMETAIKNKKLTRTLRCRIVRTIADRCFDAGVKSHVVDMVADIAVDRWSALRSEYGHKSKGFAMQVKKRIAKLKAATKDLSKESHGIEVDSASHDQSLQMMTKEMQDTQPSERILKMCLNGVRSIRLIRAQIMSAAEHLNTYPALKYQELLLWEFCSIVQLDIATMETRWSSCLKSLKQYLAGSSNAVPLYCISDDMKTIHILSILPVLLPSGKKTKGASKLVLELFREKTPLKKTVPTFSDPPRLIGIGDPSKANLSLTCYLDKTPLFTEQGVRALLQLLGFYWVFNKEFCTEARPSYLFLSTVILQRKFQSRYLYKSPTVTGLLKQLDL